MRAPPQCGPEPRAGAGAHGAPLDAGHAYARPIATRIEPGAAFYPAEADHRDFMAPHPDHPYITANDAPKLEAPGRPFPERMQAQPAPIN